MDPNSRRQKRQENALSLLNAAIEAMDLVREASSPTPAKAVFGSVSMLLTMIRVRFLRFFDVSVPGLHVVRIRLSINPTTSSLG